VDRCNNCRVEGFGDNSNSFKNDFADNNITVGNIKKTGTKGIRYESSAGVPKESMNSMFNNNMNAHGFSGTSASILLTFANPGFPGDIVIMDSTFQSTGTNFGRPPGQFGNNMNRTTFHFSKLVKTLRILGLIALISYMIVILFTWIYANMEGYVYFSAGEPVLSIKYPEWILGFLGIFVATDYLHKELSGDNL
jgi:hypothetical protein